jgi:peptide chain release factor
VAKVQELMLAAAKEARISARVLDSVEGDLNGTLRSSTILLGGNALAAFTQQWAGTVLWVAQSPYRKMHRRKNWFAGITLFELKASQQWNLKDVVLETTRASGPGGQHVNKVETAVRGKHLPSGITVLAMDSRSQLANRKLCLQRLEAKVMGWLAKQISAQQQCQWQEHNELERGNPVKTIRLPL